MGKVRTGLAVSLDGFISGPNDGAEAPMGVGGERLLAWYAGGDTGARARTGRRRGQSGPNPLPRCRLTPAPTAATARTLTVIVLGELATGGAATGWVGPRTGSASSEAGAAAASVS